MAKWRDLETGRKYTSKWRMKRAKRQSKAMKGKVDSEKMKEVSQHALKPEALAKKSESMKRYYRENPEAFGERIKMAYKENPELREKRATVLRVSRETMENYYTDQENAEKRRTHKDGKPVIKYVKKERPALTGVISTDDPDYEDWLLGKWNLRK